MNKSGLTLTVILLAQLLWISMASDPCLVTGPNQRRRTALGYCESIGCEHKSLNRMKKGSFSAECDCSTSPDFSSTAEAASFCESVGCKTDTLQAVPGRASSTCIAKPECTVSGAGPAQESTDAATKYCEDGGCFVEKIHCNFGSLSIDENGQEVFNKVALPCSPTCSDTEPENGPMMTAVMAHKAPLVGINNNDEYFDEDIIKQFYEMKNDMNMNNIMLIIYFTSIAFIITCSMICVYHKMINNNNNKRIQYEFIDKEEENIQINQ